MKPVKLESFNVIYITLLLHFINTVSEALSPTKIKKPYFGEGREGGAKSSICVTFL